MRQVPLYEFAHDEDIAKVLREELKIGTHDQRDGKSEYKRFDPLERHSIEAQIESIQWIKIPSGDLGLVFFLEESKCQDSNHPEIRFELVKAWILKRDEPKELPEVLKGSLT